MFRSNTDIYIVLKAVSIFKYTRNIFYVHYSHLKYFGNTLLCMKKAQIAAINFARRAHL